MKKSTSRETRPPTKSAHVFQRGMECTRVKKRLAGTSPLSSPPRCEYDETASSVMSSTVMMATAPRKMRMRGMGLKIEM